MGFLSRVHVQRDRAGPAAGPAAKRGGPPRGMKRVRRVMRRLRKKARGITRSLTPNKSPTKSKATGSKPVAVYHHGTCTVNHRSRKAASRCRRTR
jgi:hypothetical protein